MDGKLIVLPGRNPNLREWAQRAADEIGAAFESARVQEYRHWQDPSVEFSFFDELNRLGEFAELEPRPFIFAKSLGCMLTLTAEVTSLFTPAAQFFAGLPLREAERNEFPLADQLAQVTVPTLFIQNRHDPYGRARDLIPLLEANLQAPYRTLVLERDDHHYPELTAMRTVIEEFLDELSSADQPD